MIHKSRKVKEYLGKHNNRLITRRIPAYSPELNPDEFVWNVLKYQELPNFCPKSYDELYSKAEMTLVKMKTDPGKLKGFIKRTKLPCHQQWEIDKVKQNNSVDSMSHNCLISYKF